MVSERDLIPAQRSSPSVAERPSTAVVRCGAELVGVTERFYVGLWTVALAFVVFASLAALLVLQVHPRPQGALAAAEIVMTGLLVPLAVMAVWRAQALYRLLRRRPLLELGPVAIAVALIAQPDMAGDLWWPSCSILMALAIVAPLRRTVVYGAIVLTSNLAANVVAGDLDVRPAVAIIGLWIGYPVWLGIVAVGAALLARHLLTLNTGPPPPREAPRRVRAWTTPRDSHAAETTANAVDAPNGEAVSTEGTQAPNRVATQRLTARQLEVVMLLADGMRHREIADCLSISERQVQRHIAQAAARVNVRNSYELVALVVSDGLIPDAPR